MPIILSDYISQPDQNRALLNQAVDPILLYLNWEEWEIGRGIVAILDDLKGEREWGISSSR